MDVSWRDGHFGEERVLRELVIGIFVIERYDAFVSIKDVPVKGVKINWVDIYISGTLKGCGND